MQTSEGAVKHAGLENMVAIVRALAAQTKAPVALHLDHGKSEELARAAIDAGYTSVMIDASRQTFEENLRETRDIVAYAHARGVHVEAELGMLGGIEDLGEQAVRSMLTDPAQAVRFATETGVDALAVAIGTSHGAYKFRGAPRLDFDRLRDIAARIEQPLVLHGASSMPRCGRRARGALRRVVAARRGHSGGAHPAGGDARDREGEHGLRPAPRRPWPPASGADGADPICSTCTSSWARWRRRYARRPWRAFGSRQRRQSVRFVSKRNSWRALLRRRRLGDEQRIHQKQRLVASTPTERLPSSDVFEGEHVR